MKNNKETLLAEIRLLEKEVAELSEHDKLQRRLDELKAKKKELKPKSKLGKVAKTAGKMLYHTSIDLGSAFKGIARNYERKGKKRQDDTWNI